jgi:hypothetical protein
MKQFHHLSVAVAVAVWALCALGIGATAFAGSGAGDDAGADVPGPVADALQDALSVPSARLEVVGWKVSGGGRCNPDKASIERPIAGSGRYAVKLEGNGCGAWGWATVRVTAAVFVTTRTLRAGDALDGAVRSIDQEIRTGRAPAQVNAGSKAARAMSSGQLVEASHVELSGPSAGSPIKVLVRAGSLTIEQHGRAVSCGRGRVCAILPSGKHVEGSFEGGVLLVGVP